MKQRNHFTRNFIFWFYMGFKMKTVDWHVVAITGYVRPLNPDFCSLHRVFALEMCVLYIACSCLCCENTYQWSHLKARFLASFNHMYRLCPVNIVVTKTNGELIVFTSIFLIIHCAIDNLKKTCLLKNKSVISLVVYVVEVQTSTNNRIKDVKLKHHSVEDIGGHKKWTGFSGCGFKSHSGQLSIATSKNPSVVNTI